MIVEVETVYCDGIGSGKRRVEIPEPEELTERWWSEVAWPLTGTGRHNAPDSCNSVEIIAADTGRS